MSMFATLSSQLEVNVKRCLALIVIVLLLQLLIVWYVSHNDPLTRPCTGTQCLVTRKQPTFEADPRFSWCNVPTTTRHQASVEPVKWQPVDGRNVTVFSAFIDPRLNIGGPLVRIVASGLQTSFNQVGDLYCQLWYNDLGLSLTSGPAKYDLIYPSTMHSAMWVAHFVLCALPAGLQQLPHAVSVTSQRCTNSASNQLQILNRVSATTNIPTVALCLPALYGRSVSWLMLVEWIELHSLLGITEITIYNMSASLNVSRVFQSYINFPSPRTKLTVIPWDIPSGKLNNYFNQHEALNDCLYRSSDRHQYVAINDLDEVLVPRRHDTLTQFIQAVSRNSTESPPVGAYLFQHAYFRRNYTGQLPYLVSMQSLWRTNDVTPAGKIRCKSLYDAQQTVKVNIHFPYELVPNSQELIVDPKDGMLHHYRIDAMETFRKHPEQFQFIEDSYLLKYANRLSAAVTQRLQLIDSLYLNH